MKKLIGVVALLSMASMAMAGTAAFSFGPAVIDLGAGQDTVIVPLYATGDTEVDAMSLALELQAPLEFAGFTALQPGMLLGTSNDGGAQWADGKQIMGFDAFNGSTTVHNPVLTGAPMLVANISVKAPAGTALGSYTISTVVSAYGEYPSGMAFAGNGLDVTQATAPIAVVPEPATALLILGVLPFLRRRHA